MPLQPSDFWTWRGRVGRAKYFAAGAALFAVKHLIDRIVASAVFQRPWSLFNYWAVGEGAEIDETPLGLLNFYATLVAIALPFIWVGVVLTLRRLRDVGWPLWLVAVFFLPFVNLLFFLLLSTVPSSDGVERRARRPFGLKAALDAVVPRGSFGSAVAGVVSTTVFTVGVTFLSVEGLHNYGWGLFVGLPFCLGLSAVLVYGYHRPRPLGPCLVVALLSLLLAGAALIAVAVEGMVCVFMAAPLGAVVALFGGFIGYVIQRRPDYYGEAAGHTLHAFSIALVALPALMLAERAARVEPPLRAVRTSVEIAAPPEVVWRELVAFAELPPPRERLFKTGIAYPVRAEIEGRGAGAVRRCVFSTGAFVEPIEVWDEPRLLKFGVAAQPPVMDELSPYANLRPPHLEGYLKSREGQFLLTRLPNGNTLLEGTTWYQNSFWPSAYWNVWSDYIIHRIHLRVLEHVKRLAEQ